MSETNILCRLVDLQAAALFTLEEKGRYNLGHVLVDSVRGYTRLQACNGHMGICIGGGFATSEGSNAGGLRVCVPASAIAQIPKGKIAEVTIERSSAGAWQIRAGLATVGFEAEDAVSFPTMARIWPKELSGVPAPAFDFEYLALALKAIRLVSGNKRIVTVPIGHNGENAAILRHVEVPEVAIVLMPFREGSVVAAGELPAWVTAASDDDAGADAPGATQDAASAETGAEAPVETIDA